VWCCDKVSGISLFHYHLSIASTNVHAAAAAAVGVAFAQVIVAKGDVQWEGVSAFKHTLKLVHSQVF
jgi:hypothetical protein